MLILKIDCEIDIKKVIFLKCDLLNFYTEMSHNDLWNEFSEENIGNFDLHKLIFVLL